MMVCPICKTEAQQENQEYCLECAWEFEYYFDELSGEERNRYIKKMEIHKSMYIKSINSERVQELEKESITLNKGDKKLEDKQKGKTMEDKQKSNFFYNEILLPLIVSFLILFSIFVLLVQL